MAVIKMLTIMRVCLFVISTSSAIPQNRPGSDYYDWVENPDFYEENPEDNWNFHRTSSTTSTYEVSSESPQNNREKRELVETPEFYEEFPISIHSDGAYENFSYSTTTEFYEEQPFTGAFENISAFATTTPIPFQENESELVYAKFHSFTITVDLQWADLTKKTVKLKKINEHCHYKGFFEEDPKSVILITGCENELQSIQIQSGLFGDMLATTTNGTLEIVFGAALREGWEEVWIQFS